MIRILTLCALVILVAAPAGAQYDMEFRDARVGDVLRVLAERYDANLAVSGTIDRTTTVNLRGMDLEDALDVLLEGSGFTWRREGRDGDVIRVLSTATPVTEVYSLSYTDAAELARVITAQVPGVTVNAETHSNSLIVSGPLSAVREVAWLIDNVDRYREQVSIRAEMVEVTLGTDDVRGVDLSMIFGGSEATGSGSTDFSDGNEAINLDVRTVQGDFDVTAALAALREDREAHLLSSPEITTLDNQPAKVHVGERVPYQRATVETQTGATLAEVEFIDVGVKLDVTPTVSGDDMLYLQIHSEVSEVLDQSVQNVPRIGTREADTRVLVRHGDTVVIGGLMKDNVNTVVKKVPLLGDIPLLGMLFRRDSVQKTKTEFLVFIRPRILKDPSEMRATARDLELRREFDPVAGDPGERTPGP